METIICSLYGIKCIYGYTQCVCMYVVAMQVCVCEKFAACMHVCVMYMYAHLPHPTHLPIWLWELVCLIVHVIFGVEIQILKHPWKCMVGEATTNHGQHSLDTNLSSRAMAAGEKHQLELNLCVYLGNCCCMQQRPDLAQTHKHITMTTDLLVLGKLSVQS